MSKMAEMDMMVQEAVDMVDTEVDMYLSTAMRIIKKRWALDDEEFDMVYAEANHRVYG